VLCRPRLSVRKCQWLNSLSLFMKFDKWVLYKKPNCPVSVRCIILYVNVCVCVCVW
jgi:hypothetical protein